MHAVLEGMRGAAHRKKGYRSPPLPLGIMYYCTSRISAQRPRSATKHDQGVNDQQGHAPHHTRTISTSLTPLSNYFRSHVRQQERSRDGWQHHRACGHLVELVFEQNGQKEFVVTVRHTTNVSGSGTQHGEQQCRQVVPLQTMQPRRNCLGTLLQSPSSISMPLPRKFSWSDGGTNLVKGTGQSG